MRSPTLLTGLTGAVAVLVLVYVGLAALNLQPHITFGDPNLRIASADGAVAKPAQSATAVPPAAAAISASAPPAQPAPVVPPAPALAIGSSSTAVDGKAAIGSGATPTPTPTPTPATPPPVIAATPPAENVPPAIGTPPAPAVTDVPPEAAKPVVAEATPPFIVAPVPPARPISKTPPTSKPPAPDAAASAATVASAEPAPDAAAMADRMTPSTVTPKTPPAPLVASVPTPLARPTPPPAAAEKPVIAQTSSPVVAEKSPPDSKEAAVDTAAPTPPSDSKAPPTETAALTPQPEKPGDDADGIVQPNGDLKPVDLSRPFAERAGLLTIGGRSVQLAGIVPTDPERVCTGSNGKEWPCGTLARTALRSFLLGRTITCDVADPAWKGIVTAECRFAKLSLSDWLARNGWAEVAPGSPFTAAADEARKAGLGVYGNDPRKKHLSTLAPEPPKEDPLNPI